MPSIKQLKSPVVHALVELAFPHVLDSTATEDLERLLSPTVLPHLRRLRLGKVSGRARYSVEYVPQVSSAFLDQLEFLQLDRPTLSGTWRAPFPADHAYRTTRAPTLIELKSFAYVEPATFPCPFVRHLYVHQIDSEGPRVLPLLIEHASLEAVFLPAALNHARNAHVDAVRAACAQADVDVVWAERDKFAVILPAFVEYVREKNVKEAA
ncbi:hypothetical protein DMC30DRAFT_35613 [Rhodotorula diobovata]|uniref:Proteophosphoglycan ppg4 n=1 Tax=Rhodotorula diobovata TaxID=5288 RepID=A0A5C5FR83_9BASI|nr:hypothetical protein DMC30DRAFT_35613 [Rhodotorula diobovata]